MSTTERLGNPNTWQITSICYPTTANIAQVMNETVQIYSDIVYITVLTKSFGHLVFGHFFLISDNFQTKISDTALKHA